MERPRKRDCQDCGGDRKQELIVIISEMQFAFMAKTNLKIQGMTCGNCVAKVESALNATEGVSEVVVEQKKGSAKITYDESVVTEKDLVRVVVDAGYRAEVKRGLFG